ncbi:MAG: hypothetical protein FWG65_00935 [Turicibacter sp.]|nr:hypothetical protein [Turicibacter sp.]
MQCIYCNEYIPKENNFCGKCGKNITAAPGRIWLLVTGILSTILGVILVLISIVNFNHGASLILPLIYSCLWIFGGIMGITHRKMPEKSAFLMVLIVFLALPSLIFPAIGIVHLAIRVLVVYLIYFAVPVCYFVGAYKNYIEYSKQKAEVL